MKLHWHGVPCQAGAGTKLVVKQKVRTVFRLRRHLDVRVSKPWVSCQVGAGTKLVVMDGGDGRAVDLARALRAAGRPRSYVLRGGFRGWQAAGLPVRASDGYVSSPLDILADEVATVGAGVSGWCATLHTVGCN